MKYLSFTKRFVVTLITLLAPIILFGQTQYDYYDDGAVAGGADRALNGLIIFGVIIAIVVALFLILFVAGKVYYWFNPEANPEYKRTISAKEKEREKTIGKGSVKETDKLSDAPNEEKSITKNTDTVETEAMDSALPVSRLSNDELEYIKSIINPSKEETEKTKVDLSCRYGFASYTQDYKKFVRLSFSCCFIEEGTKAILKVLDGTETICSNAINSDYQQQVVLPDSLLYIGDNSIKCKSLKEIILPQSLKYIGDFAFFGCENLQKITIPYGVSHIGIAAFSNTGIKEIVCNSPVFSIKDHCLFDDSGQRMIKYFGSADTVIVPSDVNDINGAFAGCKDIERITLPQGLAIIGDQSFLNCTRLKEIIIQNGLQKIGRCAFMQCQSLDHIVIPEGVTVIEEFCFNYCQNLRYIVLPGTIEQIGSNDLGGSNFGIFDDNCISLGHIFIPEGSKEKFKKFFSEEILVEGTPEEYFAGVQEMETITIPEENLITSTTKQDIQEGWTDEFGYRYSADGRRLLSRTGFFQVVKDYQVKDGTVVICDGVFKDSSLETIELPDSVKKIGDSAFSGCKHLKRIKIPSTIYYFGTGVFSGCSSLQSISLPPSLEVIREYMFNGCSSLKEINIPLGVKQIHERVFYNCCSLRELIIPEGVEFIGDNAFCGCSKAQVITLPTTLKEIEGNPFGRTISTIGEKQYTVVCKSPKFIVANGALYTSDKKTLVASLSNETKFEVDEGTSKIGDSAFYENSCLESIVLPSTIVEIGNNAFRGCNFTHILLPNSIKKIGDFAFGNCEFLSKIIISEGLEILGGEAFWGCKRLSELVLPKTLCQIKKQSFGSCESLKSIKILNPNIIIDDEAFSFLDSLEQIEFSGIPSVVDGNPFSWTDNLKEIIVPWGTKKQFCLLFPSKKDIIKTKSKTKDTTKQEQLDLSTEITEKDKAEIEARKDGSDFIYTYDGRKLLSCECKETLNKPIPFEDEYGRMVVFYNNRIMGYDEYNSMMDRWDDEFYYEVTPGTVVICDKAFSQCENLGEILIPESVKAIGIRAFEDCKSLKQFTFPSEVKVVKEYCFIACTNLKSVKLPDSLEIIEKAAFGACKLNKIEFPETVKTIGFAAFQGCPLEEIKLPKNLEVIESMAFCYTKIKELTIPKEVKLIGRKAFVDCFNLKKIEFEGIDVECDNNAFVNAVDEEGHCKKMPLDVIIVPNGAKSIFTSKLPQYSEIIVEKE